MVRYQFMFRY